MLLCTRAVFPNITHRVQFQDPALHGANVTLSVQEFSWPLLLESKNEEM